MTDHPDPYPLREWQAAALPKIRQAVRERWRAVVSACTGAGKTDVIAAYLKRDVLPTLPGEWVVLVTVPTQALVRQTAARINRWCGPVAGEFYADRKEVQRVVVCCHPSVVSLSGWLAREGLRVALLVSDECHKLTGEALEAVEALEPRTRVGFTGTPFRSAGPLEGWQSLAVRYALPDALRDGVIVPPRFVWPEEEQDPDDLLAEEYTIGVCRSAVGPGVVSAVDIEDAEYIARALTAAGVPCAAVHSKLPRVVNDDRIGQLSAGYLKCVSNVGLLVEGVDLPWLRWGCIRRPEKARVRALQHLGRYLRHDGERRWGDQVLPAKTEAVIYDRCNSYGMRDLAPGADFGEAIGEVEERLAGVTREVPEESETMLPETVVIDRLTAWLLDARIQAQLWGAEPAKGPRHGPAQGWQVRALLAMKERRWRGVSRLPKKQREAVKDLINNEERLAAMPAAALTDLISICENAHRRWVDEKARTGAWRWRVPGFMPEPPEVAGRA